RTHAFTHALHILATSYSYGTGYSLATVTTTPPHPIVVVTPDTKNYTQKFIQLGYTHTHHNQHPSHTAIVNRPPTHRRRELCRYIPPKPCRYSRFITRSMVDAVGMDTVWGHRI
ncbi:fructose-bisphosphate aldolase 1, partial [Striga asiatica]